MFDESTERRQEIEAVEHCRAALESALQKLLADIGDVAIGAQAQFPFGWRKAAKGRTVWRLLEEVISQNLEAKHKALGFDFLAPAESEVDVFDFEFSIDDSPRHYVNIKSAVKGGRKNKDDLSKARLLEQFFQKDSSRVLLVATIQIEFLDTMALRLDKATVIPITWVPDIYVNPSNNGNLQSSKYKSLATATRRTGAEFLELLQQEIAVADAKRASKRR